MSLASQTFEARFVIVTFDARFVIVLSSKNEDKIRVLFLRFWMIERGRNERQTSLASDL